MFLCCKLEVMILASQIQTGAKCKIKKTIKTHIKAPKDLAKRQIDK